MTEADQHQYVIPRLNWQAANPTPYILSPWIASLCPQLGYDNGVAPPPELGIQCAGL